LQDHYDLPYPDDYDLWLAGRPEYVIVVDQLRGWQPGGPLSLAVRSSARVRDDAARAVCCPAVCSSYGIVSAANEFAGSQVGSQCRQMPGDLTGHIGPGSWHVNGTSGDSWPCLATGPACMACKRSGVRIP
jgi:hypothetical protein